MSGGLWRRRWRRHRHSAGSDATFSATPPPPPPANAAPTFGALTFSGSEETDVTAHLHVANRNSTGDLQLTGLLVPSSVTLENLVVPRN
jgi:hypothetical protein